MNKIADTRLVPIAPNFNNINRPVLIEKISVNINKSLILINAPAGYGKTTLLYEFLESSRFRYSWLNIHEGIEDYYTFITYLIHSLRPLNSNFGSLTLGLIDDYRKRYQLDKNLNKIVNDISITFANELFSGFKEELIIVIEDLGRIQNSGWMNSAFQVIFDNLSPNIHFIITSRQVPDINLTVLQAKRKLFKIETSDLKFTTNEIINLLSRLYGIECSTENANILKNKMDGWVTGIHLVLQRYGSDFISFNLDKIIFTEDIFNYFTEDIFEGLDEDVKNFLLDTSLLDSFSASISDLLFKKNNSRKIINYLINKNIFIQPAKQTDTNTEPFYEYQPLFKSFLESKLDEIKDCEDIAGLHNIISNYYLENKNYNNAIIYALKSGNTDIAVMLIIAHFQEFYDAGNYGLIWKWFSGLDDRIIEKNPYLLYYKSLMIKFYKGNLSESMPYIDKAIRLALHEKNQDILVICYISKFKNMIRQGNVTDVIGYINKIINDDINDENKARLYYLLAYANFLNSDYDASLRLQNKALEHLGNHDAHGTQGEIFIDIYNLFGHIYLIFGEYSRSVSFYERVAKESSQIIDRFEAYCNLVLLYSHSGKFDKAFIYSEKAKEIIDKVTVPIFEISYLMAKQSISFESGDYEESINILNEINRIAGTLNHKFYLYLSWSLIGDSYYYLNELEMSENVYDRAFRYVNDENMHEKTQYAFSKALLLKKTEMLPSVEKILVDAYEYYDGNKFTYNKTLAAFHLADYYYRIQDYSLCLRYLEEAISICEKMGYYSFLSREFNDLRYLFDLALANNICKTFTRLISAGIEMRTLNISDTGKKRISSAMDSFYDIKLKTLGSQEISVRGKIIEDKDWTKKKWKQVFIYLINSPKMELTKDKILDVFFKDTPPESSDNIFHQAVSKIRNLVKLYRDIPQNNDTKLSLYPLLVLYEGKTLKASKDALICADNIEFEKIYRSLNSIKAINEKIPVLEKAVNLYSGDFLEEEYDTWIEELRSRYKTYFVYMAEDLIKLLYNNGEFNKALKYTEHLLKFDNLNLPAYEYSLNIYLKTNKTGIAKARFAHFSKTYKEEYGENLPSSFFDKFNSIVS